MFCHTKPNVTQTNFYKLHPKLHPYQDEVDRDFDSYLGYLHGYLLRVCRTRAPAGSGQSVRKNLTLGLRRADGILYRRSAGSAASNGDVVAS
jgi:hypothetical protein